MMSLLNEIYDAGSITHEELRTLLKLANPFAPHVTEEIWSVMNFGGQISGQSWPTYDPAKCVDSMVEIAVQLAGKIKARIMVPTDITAADAIAAAKAICQGTAAGRQDHHQGDLCSRQAGEHCGKRLIFYRFFRRKPLDTARWI